MQKTLCSTNTTEFLNPVDSGMWVQINRSLINRDNFHLLLGLASAEWKGILMLGRYCGLNLMQCARLRRWHLNYDRSALCITRAESGPSLRIPLGPRLISYLRMLSLENCDTPLFPIALEKKCDDLEADFRILVAKIGLDANNRRFYAVCFKMPSKSKGL